MLDVLRVRRAQSSHRRDGIGVVQFETDGETSIPYAFIAVHSSPALAMDRAMLTGYRLPRRCPRR